MSPDPVVLALLMLNFEQFGTIYQIGPQLPPTISDEWSAESKKGDCKAYLDASAPKSVLYIRCGNHVLRLSLPS